MSKTTTHFGGQVPKSLAKQVEGVIKELNQSLGDSHVQVNRSSALRSALADWVKKHTK